MKRLIAAALLVFACSNFAQADDQKELKTNRRDTAFHWLLGGYIVLQSADIYLTHRGTELGFEEANPVFDTGRSVIAAKAAIVPLTTWGLSAVHKKHPGLAKGLLIGLNAVYAGIVYHNMKVLKEVD
ncbi:MAG: hypothetical protein A3B31_03630 [Candidatus Komeilibacteria bacterium RIFCSPLOWO2_01_FULL_53_11]|uniref:Uncharacterized protein n=1 Tax=Candidatus Komeilibacteria bacterium RIFCSPLOWO2_01_FULL_53_11 TaxID=1798552 RepID=A0A1G2BX75_9BACT|nr:MAG: hypothetical protein A3B31_03630 [Candidatus Komeilibacteria bacterium RIFCSPLOWO2_01_FULL_53_11]